MRLVKNVLPGIALLCTAVLHPVSTAVADDPSTRPIADGDFTTAGDPGWIFFIPHGFGGQGCGISPDGLIGCDVVPSRSADGTPIQAGLPGPPGFYSCGGENCPLPPPGANQIVVGPQDPAHYAESATPTFTRAVDVLPNGYRVVNGNAYCSISEQNVLRCATGDHGFSVQAVGVTLD